MSEEELHREHRAGGTEDTEMRSDECRFAKQKLFTEKKHALASLERFIRLML